MYMNAAVEIGFKSANYSVSEGEGSLTFEAESNGNFAIPINFIVTDSKGTANSECLDAYICACVCVCMCTCVFVCVWMCVCFCVDET